MAAPRIAIVILTSLLCAAFTARAEDRHYVIHMSAESLAHETKPDVAYHLYAFIGGRCVRQHVDPPVETRCSGGTYLPIILSSVKAEPPDHLTPISWVPEFLENEKAPGYFKTMFDLRFSEKRISTDIAARVKGPKGLSMWDQVVLGLNKQRKMMERAARKNEGATSSTRCDLTKPIEARLIVFFENLAAGRDGDGESCKGDYFYLRPPDRPARDLLASGDPQEVLSGGEPAYAEPVDIQEGIDSAGMIRLRLSASLEDASE